MKEVIRFGIIGCGEISVVTCQGIAECRHSRIEMVMDVDESLCRDAGDTHGVPYTTELEKLLKNPEIDAVYIAVPHFLHKEVSVKALQNNKHVLLEKPIGVNVAEANEIIDAAKKHDRQCGIAMLRRYYAESKKAKALLDKDAIGQVVTVFISSFGLKKESYWGGGFTGRSASDWRTKRETAGGGVLIMNVYHDLDLMTYLMETECVSASGYYDTFAASVEVEDTFTSILKYANGAIGSATATCIAQGGSPPGVAGFTRLIGKKGQLVFANGIQLYCSEAIDGYSPGEWHTIDIEGVEHHVMRSEMVDAFSRNLLENKIVPAGVGEILNVQQTCEWIYGRNGLG